MKFRDGFVSNSSSSSFIVVLPEDLDVTKFVEENYDKSEDNPGELEWQGEEIDRTELVSTIEQLMNGETVTEDDCDYSVYMSLDEKLKDFCIRVIDVESGSGCYEGVKFADLSKQLKKIGEYRA